MKIPFWVVADLVTQTASPGGFQVLLEDIVPGAGTLVSGSLSRYSADGTPFEKGDVLFGKLRPYLAKFWLADREGVAGGDIHVYRPRKGVDPRYLAYIVGSRNFLRFAVAASKGVKMPRVEWMDIRQYGVNRYDERTQRRIADYLDRETGEIDAMMAKLSELEQVLIGRRSAMILDATRQGKQIADSEAMPASYESLEDEWSMVPLKYAVEGFQTGVWGEEADGGVDDVRCARVADFDRLSICVTEVPTIRSVPRKDRLRCGLERGDILVEKSGGTSRNPVGAAVAYMGDTPAVCSNFIIRLRCRQSQCPRFWLYVLHGSYIAGRTWSYVRQTTGIQNLDVNGFMSMSHPVPDFDEQRRIADHLDEVTGRIDAMLAKIDELKALLVERRSALITDVVTGRKKIPS